VPATSYDLAIGRRLRRLREARDWSLEDLAKACAGATITSSQISKLERGMQQFTAQWICRFADALNCYPTDLMTDSPIPLPEQMLAEKIRCLSEEDRRAIEWLIDAIPPKASAPAEPAACLSGSEAYAMATQDVLEMAYPKRYVEHIITGLEDPLNQHLIKLVGFDFAPELREHFRQECEASLDKIQRLRMKPNNQTGPVKFYYDLLYDYPFGGVEVQNMRSVMDFVTRRYPGVRATKTPEEIIEWLQRFHTTLAARLHGGQSVLDLIPN